MAATWYTTFTSAPTSRSTTATKVVSVSPLALSTGSDCASVSFQKSKINSCNKFWFMHIRLRRLQS
jgi:hypothetical protein